MALRNTPGAFGAVAVALHWIIAVAILAMIAGAAVSGRSNT